MKSLIPAERIEKKIYIIRGQRVMLGQDIADIYGVEVRALIQTVKRNIGRFPRQYMFQLNENEYINLKSQIVISSWGGSRVFPYAFTEHGVVMLSSVLKSKKAVQISLVVVEAFVRLRRVIENSKIVSSKVREHDVRLLLHDKKLKEHEESITAVVAHLMSKQKKNEEKKKFGFKT
jgi:hypothetical protein